MARNKVSVEIIKLPLILHTGLRVYVRVDVSVDLRCVPTGTEFKESCTTSWPGWRPRAIIGRQWEALTTKHCSDIKERCLQTKLCATVTRNERANGGSSLHRTLRSKPTANGWYWAQRRSHSGCHGVDATPINCIPMAYPARRCISGDAVWSVCFGERRLFTLHAYLLRYCEGNRP